MQTQTVYPMSDPSLSPVPLKKSAKESRTNNKVVGGITASLCNIPIAYLLIRSVPLSSVSIQVTYLFVFSDILAALFISARSIFVLASINCIFIVFAFYFLPWSIEYVQAIPVNGYGSMVGSMVLVPIIAQISTAIIVYLLVRKLSPLKQP